MVKIFPLLAEIHNQAFILFNTRFLLISLRIITKEEPFATHYLNQKNYEGIKISSPIPTRTLGTAAWKRMLVTGMGAEDSIEMITTNTSGLDGGESRANVNKTRRLCLSNTVTGKTLPVVKKKKYRNDIKKKAEHNVVNGFHLVTNIKRRLMLHLQSILKNLSSNQTLKSFKP